MDPETSERLETVANRLSEEPSKSKEGEENFEFYSCSSRILSCSPAEAEFGDSPRDRIDDMAIEDTCEWDDTSSRALGLPAVPHPAEQFEPMNPSTRPETPNFNSDFENLFSTEEHHEELGLCTAGVCGLANLGNTCFMNSGLQCLLNTPSMLQFFLNYNKDSANADNLATHLASLFQKVWSGKFHKVKPVEFHKALGQQHAQFKDYRQHDCQEFLALLLNTLHELLNTASSKSHISDLSVEPMTPRSVCEEDTGTSLVRATSEQGDTDSISQMALSLGNRCEASSSSHSSESSIGTSQIRLRPIPDDVQPFRSLPVSASPSTCALAGEIMDSITETADGDDCQDIPTPIDNTNLIDQSSLLKQMDCSLTSGLTVDERNQSLNNSKRLHGYEDILKDAKTSNVNVLVTESGANNEIIFDSDKFPKQDNLRRREAVDNPNFTEFYNFEGKSMRIKRIKETNKLNNQQDLTEAFPSDFYSCNNNKRFKMEGSMEKEKNVRMEYERKLRGDPTEDGFAEGAAGFSHTNSSALLVDEDLEADKQWEKHLGQNQSIIVDSFQGQFKSTVVCSECRHISSTYEPFMYLSVPLPHAMEQQISVTFVPANTSPPTKFLLTLNRQDKIAKMKEQLRVLMKANVDMALELAEVLDHHIARILDDSHLIRYLGIDDPHRSIYAFEISNELLEPFEVNEPVPVPDSNNNNNSNIDEWKSCTICLEEMEKGLKNHKGCSCFLCDNCIERSVKHFADTENFIEENTLRCPVCGEIISSGRDLIAIDAEESSQMAKRTQPRLLKVPVLFRLDGYEEGRPQLFGHPHLIRIPNRLSGAELYQCIGKLVPYLADYRLLFVDGQGYHCSRCMYNTRCKGCPIEMDQPVSLRNGDYIAVRFDQPVVEIPVVCHPSLLAKRKQEELSLYDCLDAFTESETLDEHNPWYCPTCQKNQCATKTLTVWRYPEFLIVYLKRFIFYDYTSVKLDNKVSFPVTDLTLVAPSGVSRRYNLYACVNHFGGASAGHYTAYAKHPHSGDWHLFNDDTVTHQKPEDEDYTNAYVLFYHKQGVPGNSLMNFITANNVKPNLDQLILELDSSVERDSWAQSVSV